MANIGLNWTEFLKGVEVGRRLKLQRLSTRTPVAYQYNGITFPPVPAEMNGYPYLRIVVLSGIYYIQALPTKPVTTIKEVVLGSTVISRSEINSMEEANDYLSAYFVISSSGDWGIPDSINGTGEVSTKNIVWSNYDVLTAEGDIYLSSSEPIPIYEGRKYSYNGAILPELPEWDDATYPFVFIIKRENEAYYTMCCCSELPTTYIGTGDKVYHGTGSTTKLMCTTNDDRTCWFQFKSSSSNVNTFLNDTLVWANYDIMNIDNTVYLATSEPIPV